MNNEIKQIKFVRKFYTQIDLRIYETVANTEIHLLNGYSSIFLQFAEIASRTHRTAENFYVHTRDEMKKTFLFTT